MIPQMTKQNDVFQLEEILVKNLLFFLDVSFIVLFHLSIVRDCLICHIWLFILKTFYFLAVFLDRYFINIVISLRDIIFRYFLISISMNLLHSFDFGLILINVLQINHLLFSLLEIGWILDCLPLSQISLGHFHLSFF